MFYIIYKKNHCHFLGFWVSCYDLITFSDTSSASSKMWTTLLSSGSWFWSHSTHTLSDPRPFNSTSHGVICKHSCINAGNPTHNEKEEEEDTCLLEICKLNSSRFSLGNSSPNDHGNSSRLKHLHFTRLSFTEWLWMDFNCTHYVLSGNFWMPNEIWPSDACCNWGMDECQEECAGRVLHCFLQAVNSKTHFLIWILKAVCEILTRLYVSTNTNVPPL